MNKPLKKIIFWWPVLLLSGVFCTQVYFKNTAQLSNWRGGGFGMYSTFHPSNRFIRVSFILPNKELFSFTSYKGEWRTVGFKTKIFPSLSNFKELEVQVKELQWVYSNYQKNQISVAEAGESINPDLLLKPDSLKLEIYEPQLTGKELELEKKLIATFVNTWSDD